MNKSVGPLVRIFHTTFDKEIGEEQVKYYMNLLNPAMQLEISQYRRWQDRQLTLFGKLLLRKGLESFGLTAGNLSQVKSTHFGRPFVTENIKFNITHSGNRVLCAISEETELGLDIEQIRPVDFDDFRDTMTKIQWQRIESAENPIHEFFKLWTMKESAIKADGRGLSIPLNNLEIISETILLEKNLWHLTMLNIHNDFAACLATAQPNAKIELKYIELNQS